MPPSPCLDLPEEDDLPLEEPPASSSSAGAELAAVEHRLALVEREVADLLEEQAELQDRRAHLQYAAAQDARAPRSDWQGAFAWDAQALQLLQGTFGLSQYRCVASGRVLPYARWVLTPGDTGTTRGRSSTAPCRAGTRCASFPAAAASRCAISSQPSWART